MQLYAGSGASDLTLLDLAYPPEEEQSVLRTLRNLLTERRAHGALQLLGHATFRLYNGTNHFNDEFQVLHATVPVAAYETFRQNVGENSPDAIAIADALVEIQVPVRFIGVALAREAPGPDYLSPRRSDVVDVRVGQWFGPWEVIELDLGKGGQGHVHKVRRVDMAALGRAASDLGRSVDTARTTTSTNSEIGLAVRNALRVFRVAESAPVGALKVLVNPSKKTKERLAREAAAYELIQHPNLLKLLDRDPDGTWLVTEFQEGGSLAANPGHFRGNVPAAVAALRPLVDVLGRLHKAGFVHRDIKAGNVFFTPSNGLLLGDAGLVFHPDDTTLSSIGEKRGTSYFMPPEAVDSPDEPKTTWDIYSVAKLLWCLIAGKRVLPEMHRSRGYDLQEQFEGQTLSRVNTLLDECLASHPDDRRVTDAPLLLERLDDLIAAGATAHEKPAVRRHASVLGVRTSAPSDPRIVVRECSYKVTYRGPGLWQFSWRLTVGNLTTEALRLTGRVHLSDADDYRVASDSLPDTTAAAEAVVTMHGIATVSVPGAATITAIDHEIDLQAAPEPWPTRESLGQDQRRVLQHLASNPRRSFTLAELEKSLGFPREVIQDVLRRLDDLRLLEARHDDALGTRYSLSALGRAVGST